MKGQLETKLFEMLQKVKLPDRHDFKMRCIYRVPEWIRENNPKAYTSRCVSIGPFHKPCEIEKENVFGIGKMEELKIKYVNGFLHRTRLSLGDFVITLKLSEEKIRSSYVTQIRKMFLQQREFDNILTTIPGIL